MSQTMYENLERVNDSHPNRCQAIRPGVGTQCNFKSVEGGEVCLMHGGVHVENSIRVASFNNYRLKKYQARMREFAESNHLRTVDEEIGILRLVLEEVLNRCEDGVDLLLYSQKIGDLVGDITKCVIVADKLVTKAGMLIGRSEAMTIAHKVIEVISNIGLTDEQLLKVSEDISDAFVMKVQSYALTDGSRRS